MIPTKTKIRRWPVLILALGSLIATSFGSRSVEALWWPEAACNRSCTPKLCMNPKRLNNCVANCGDHSKIIDCFTKNRSALSEENKEKVLKNLSLHRKALIFFLPTKRIITKAAQIMFALKHTSCYTGTK